jgi:hypothetical protein
MNAWSIAWLAAIAGIWWMCTREDTAASATESGDLQAGVLPGGFVFTMGGSDIGYRVAELDRDGDELRALPVHLKRDARVVGTRDGSAIGWLEGKRLKFAVLDKDGGHGDASTWGKNVRQLCEGAASNQHRFGIGFLESDGRVWFVHGPVAHNDTFEAPVVAEAELARASWCRVASAEDNIALLWRDGSRLLMNFCSRTNCSSTVTRVPIERSEHILGFGCVRDSCLIAARGKRGVTRLLHLTERGQLTVTSLDSDPEIERPVHVVGVGARGFAISYFAEDGWTKISRVETDGARTVLLRHPTISPPIIAWADDKLLVGFSSGETAVLRVPK